MLLHVTLFRRISIQASSHFPDVHNHEYTALATLYDSLPPNLPLSSEGLEHPCYTCIAVFQAILTTARIVLRVDY